MARGDIGCNELFPSSRSWFCQWHCSALLVMKAQRRWPCSFAASQAASLKQHHHTRPLCHLQAVALQFLYRMFWRIVSLLYCSAWCWCWSSWERGWRCALGFSGMCQRRTNCLIDSLVSHFSTGFVVRWRTSFYALLHPEKPETLAAYPGANECAPWLAKL